MLQRLGSGDLHFRHGEATANAHTLASWKSDYIAKRLKYFCGLQGTELQDTASNW